MTPGDRMLKRSLDIIVACLGIALLAPLFALVALAIKLDTPGPIFFRQERLGRNGRHFRIFKFRSMVSNAHRLGGSLTIGGDVRITRSGRFLRHHKLDELPQLFNVLAGDMSMVGPRPEVPEYAALFPADFDRILTVRPGITHRATLLFRNEEEILARASDPRAHYIDKIMPAKMRLYVDSLSESSVMDDIRTIVDTVLTVGGAGPQAELPQDELEIAVTRRAPIATRVAPSPPISVKLAEVQEQVRETVA